MSRKFHSCFGIVILLNYCSNFETPFLKILNVYTCRKNKFNSSFSAFSWWIFVRCVIYFSIYSRRLIFKLLIGINRFIEMSLKLVKMNEIKKNKWFQQAITMKTIIPESYNSNGAVLRCKQHLYILMIENIVPIYRLEYSETPFGSPGKNLAHISPKIVQGLCSSKFAVFLSPHMTLKIFRCTFVHIYSKSDDN